MSLRRIASSLAAPLALAALASAAPAAAPNWLATVTLTPAGSHVLGNPRAPHKVTAWISYTCPHCAAFEQASDTPLKQGYLRKGRFALEVRHLLRDPIDATVAQLANCGPKERFFANHTMFFRRQQDWIQPLASATEGQRQRWTTGAYTARRRAIASDFHLYELMEKRGYSRPEIDRCLADDALARRLAAQTAAAVQLGVAGTPSFALDGKLLADTYSWPALEPQLRAAP